MNRAGVMSCEGGYWSNSIGDIIILYYGASRAHLTTINAQMYANVLIA